MGISLRYFLVGLYVLLSIAVVAQVKSVKQAQGAAAIVNITPEEAKHRAIENAKAEALRMAGAQEWIQAFDFLDKREVNKTIDEFFHSVTSVQTMGSVLSWKLVSEQKKLDDRSNLSYEVVIDAVVKLYETRPDPKFNLVVDGLEPVYKNNGSLQFTITPSTEGYLTVFNVDQQSIVTQIFPNPHEVMFKLLPEKKHTFPVSKYFRYEVYSDLKEEVNNIFFLYTKTNVPYLGKSFSDFIEHIYKIEPQDRFLVLEKFRIVQ